jgi:hypothetical protein
MNEKSKVYLVMSKEIANIISRRSAHFAQKILRFDVTVINVYTEIF